MISRMNVVHEAARLAVGDHRTADSLPRRGRRPVIGLRQRMLMLVAVLLLVVLTLPLLAG